MNDEPNADRDDTQEIEPVKIDEATLSTALEAYIAADSEYQLLIKEWAHTNSLVRTEAQRVALGAATAARRDASVRLGDLFPVDDTQPPGHPLLAIPIEGRTYMTAVHLLDLGEGDYQYVVKVVPPPVEYHLIGTAP